MYIAVPIAICHAMDNAGCLTCHQYPGLVTQESPGNYKILHINEEKYLQSSHRKVDCRKCHMSVKKVPHTGETVVNCNTECHKDGSDNSLVTMDSYNTDVACATECHVDDRDNIKSMEKYLHSFHDNERSAILYLESESSCRVCHTLYPHSKSKKVRAFINMHAGFMTCEVCHAKKITQSNYTVCKECHSNTRTFSYNWKSPENVEFIGDPFGTFYKNSPNESMLMLDIKILIRGMLIDYVPRKYLPNIYRETDYAISRIAVYTEEGSIVLNTKDTEKALTYIKQKNRLSEKTIKRRLKTFHKDTAKTDISLACNECHKPTGLINFREFGFNEIKANKLQKLNIKGFATKYTTFHFPHLLNAKKSGKNDM